MIAEPIALSSPHGTNTILHLEHCSRRGGLDCLRQTITESS
jgi:hypothetical protein